MNFQLFHERSVNKVGGVPAQVWSDPSLELERPDFERVPTGQVGSGVNVDASGYSPTNSLELRHFWTLHKHKVRLRHKVVYFPVHLRGTCLLETSRI